MSTPNERLKVFVSYSRADLDFSDQLVLALEDKGFEALVDRHDIDAAEKWKDRLGALIASCDTVVFVLSEKSAGSPICRWEVEEAGRLGKRIIPVVPQDPSGVSPPPQLGELNYIHFFKHPNVPGSGFYDGVQKLERALRVNLVWLRRQTAYAEQATAWMADKSDDRVLAGKPLEEALTWRASAPAGATIAPLVLDYLTASETVAARRRAEADANIAVRETALKRARRATTIALTIALLLMLAVSFGGVGVASMMSGLGLQRSQALASLARQASDVMDYERAARYALAGIRDSSSIIGGFRADEAEVELTRAWVAHRKNFVFHAVGGGIVGATLSGDGKTIAIWDTEQNVRVLDVDTGVVVLRERLDYSAAYGVNGMFSPDARYFALSIGAEPGEITTTAVYDLSAKRQAAMIEGWLVAFHPTANEVIAVFEENGVGNGNEPWRRNGVTAIWSIDTYATPRVVLPDDAMPSGYAPDGISIVGSRGGRVTLWRAADGVETAAFGEPSSPPKSFDAAFSHDGQRIVVYRDAQPALAFDATTHALLGEMGAGVRAQAGDLRDAADPASATDWRARPLRDQCGARYAADGRTVAIARCRWGLTLRDVATGKVIRDLAVSYGVAKRIEFSNDLSRAMAIYPGAIRVFPDLFKEDEADEIRLEASAPVRTAALTSDGSAAVAFLSDSSAELWNITARRRVVSISGAERLLGSLFSADGRVVVVSNASRQTVELRNVSDGTVVASFPHPGEVVRQAYLDGDDILTSTNTCVVRRWSRSSRQARVLWRGGEGCAGLQIARDGATALRFGEDNKVSLVNIATGQPIAALLADGTIYGCPLQERACEFFKGDRVIFVGQADSLVFNARTGEQITHLDTRLSAISDDGRLGLETAWRGAETARLHDLSGAGMLYQLNGDVSRLGERYVFYGDRLVQFADDFRDGNVWALPTGHLVADEFARGRTLSVSPARALDWQERTLFVSDVSRSLTTRGRDLVDAVCRSFFAYESDRRLTEVERRAAPMLDDHFFGDLCASDGPFSWGAAHG